MAISRAPLGGILLVGGICMAAAAFGALNWQWLQQRRMLEREGVEAVARIEAVTISHKACNSSATVFWADRRGISHRGQFMTCFANRVPGQAVKIRYLETQPDIAMIADGEGGLPDSQYQTGMWIGGLAAAVTGVMVVGLVMRRTRSIA